MQEVEFEGSKYTIKTEPMTIGDLMDMTAYMDYLKWYSQRLLPEQVPCSEDSKEFYGQVARALVIVKAGLAPPGHSNMNPMTLLQLRGKLPEFVKFICHQYDISKEPALATTEEEAKKK